MIDFLVGNDSLLFILFALAGWLVALNGSLKSFLHLLQLEDYEAGRMLRILTQQPRRLKLLGPELTALPVLLILVKVLFWSGLGAESSFADIFGRRIVDETWAPAWFIWGAGCFWRAWRMHRVSRLAKKPLVMTARAKRILWLGFGLSILITILLSTFISLIRFYTIRYEFGAELYILSIPWAAVFWITIFGIMYLVERAAPLSLTLSVMMLKPFEFIVQQRYLSDARKILDRINPIVIGVTGSYGKTGTKEILSAMLAEKYNVFRPPGSYNTLMGVTRVVREQMRPYHEVFVVEMGAYRIGSIDRLSRLVKPKHGIITIIGVQHLERFKTRDNIKTAKGELIRALPQDGIAVLNSDDEACREIGADFQGNVTWFSLSKPGNDGDTLFVENIRIGADGSDFDIDYPDGERQSVHLSLLGRSAVANAAAAAAMADRLGVPRAGIKRALANMSHVRHRLEPIRREGGITVLDDAFNSNPVGARNALEVLAAAKDGRRILVTPGMIELGSLEAKANREFGSLAAQACDLVVLIGEKRIEPIRQGLLENRFNPDRILVVESLNEGLERLKSYLQPGDTMLLENDLPDQYDGT